MLEIKKLSDTKLTKTFLFYGKTGTGKTTLAATFPKPFFIDINEEGTSSVKNFEGDYVTIEKYEDFLEFVNEIDKYMEKSNFKTLIVDTVCKLQDLNLNFLANGKKVLVNHYGDSNHELQQIFLRLIDYCKKNDLYLIFNAHERDNTVADEVSGEILNPNVGPQLTPKLAEWLQSICSVVSHIRKVERKDELGKSLGVYYCAKIGPDSVFKTKIRIPKDYMKVNMIVNPDANKLLAILDGTYEEKYMKKKKEA